MTDRIRKINELVKRELGRIFLKEIDFPENTLVTLTQVKTSPDLKNAKILFSVLPEENTPKVLKLLKNNVRICQRLLNKRLKTKIVPKIFFLEEKAVREAAEIEKALERIKRIEKR